MLGRNETALIEALRTHRDCERLVRTIDSLPAVPSEELLGRYVVDAPALYVVPGTFTVRDGVLYPTFTIAAVASNVAGQAQARNGDGVDIGVDQLMVLAVRAVNEHRIGDCTWLLQRGGLVDDELFSASGLTAMELVFEGSACALPSDWSAEELEDFLRFHADIDIEPHAGETEHRKWLQEPPDFSSSRPDADLDVQLPGASSP